MVFNLIAWRPSVYVSRRNRTIRFSSKQRASLTIVAGQQGDVLHILTVGSETLNMDVLIKRDDEGD
jgi:hypothetical protein